MLDDTIVAISTPLGESGIGIVRMSGRDCLRIADRMFSRGDARGVFDFSDHSINHGWIMDPGSGQVVDEVLISILKAPKTYTREDMVEINCHGGMIAVSRTMDLAIRLGARPALPGEFTKRAFLNGRIDLAQAEAVLDIISAQSEEGLSYALRRLRGSIRDATTGIRQGLVRIQSHVEAGIDFEDQMRPDTGSILEEIDSLAKGIRALIEGYESMRQRERGIRIVICGRTNVGKSTLLNAVYGDDRIITSTIPGTTRDSVQVEIIMDGMIFHVVDTAGIRQGRGALDELCAGKTREEIERSDLIIVVFDISRRLSKDDERVVRMLGDRRGDILWVGNKKDLPRAINMKALKTLISNETLIEVSAKEAKGLDLLVNEIKRRKEKMHGSVYEGIMINKRINGHLMRIGEVLDRVGDLYTEGIGEEIIAEELRCAVQELDNIEGRGSCDEVIESIFSQFCIGK
ncbi:MAG: tRNA uridine-5-carboxymethylaminomethyl(34) synthesis GTPase MnmE [bacterium]